MTTAVELVSSTITTSSANTTPVEGKYVVNHTLFKKWYDKVNKRVLCKIARFRGVDQSCLNFTIEDLPDQPYYDYFIENTTFKYMAHLVFRNYIRNYLLQIILPNISYEAAPVVTA